MTKYNFDEIITRKNSNCVKYDGYQDIYGVDNLIPLWVADMDFKTPDFIFDAIKNRINHPILGYFIHSDGFYNSIIKWMERHHQWNVEKEWIYFSPGIVAGLAVIVQAFTDKGDKIIVQTPVYHPFFYVIKNQQRQIVDNSLQKSEDSYVIDFDDLENKLKAGAKMMIMSNPHNPVGRCWQREELKKVGELCLKYHCVLVSDEIHSDLIMPGYKHVPVAGISDAIAQNTITCMAPSKTFNLAGLSTSEIIIPNPIMRRQFEKIMFDGLHMQAGNVFGDIALEAAYTHGDEWLSQLIQYLSDNINYVHDFIHTHLPVVKTYRHEATYLPWLDFSQLHLTHEEISHVLIDKAKIALNDGLIFGENGRCHFRLNAACPRKILEQAMDQLEQAINN